MSIIFIFTRISPADADRITGSLDVPDEFLDAPTLAEGEPSGDLDQAWDGLRLLFPAAAVDFDLLHDDQPTHREDCLSVWTPEEVAAAAKVLSSTPFDRLAAVFSPELMDEEAARPDIWDDRDEALEYLGDGYAQLREFFAYASSTNSAVIGRFA
ncbi:DUF1877 family protein [Nocardia sp. NPDC058480]|uniref:DUF1877 family protein n=1 Tax=Nocardia sp. NPDC058480 TaxID=3346522 RepID=UPI003659567D